MIATKNIPTSIRQKLLNLSRKNGEDFQRLLVRYAIERFLFRLSRHASRERFVLKGAMLLMTWPEGMHRPTGDLDLLAYGPNQPAAMKATIIEICEITDPQDGLVFDSAFVEVVAMREEDKYAGLCIKLRAMIESTRIPFQIDMGFGDAVNPEPINIEFPTIFEGMPTARIRAYPPETVIAEKFHAMVKFGVADGRLKDFSDIWAITQNFNFEMAELVQALLGTFANRQTKMPTEIPIALTDAFADAENKVTMWQAFLRNNPPATPPPDLKAVLAELRLFIAPVLTAASDPDNARGKWPPGGGWNF